MKFKNFFYFPVGHFCPPGSGSGSTIWMRIRIHNLNADPDPDPATQINVDPCGSGSETPTVGRSGASRWSARVSQSLSVSAYSRNSPSISRQVLRSISASSDTVESKGRQMKEVLNTVHRKKYPKCPFQKLYCCVRIRIQLFYLIADPDPGSQTNADPVVRL